MPAPEGLGLIRRVERPASLERSIAKELVGRPREALAPDFSTTFTWAPALRPYSAS